MLKKKWSGLFILMLILLMVLSSCNKPAPPPVDEPVITDPSKGNEKPPVVEPEPKPEPEPDPYVEKDILGEVIDDPQNEDVVILDPLGLQENTPVDDSYFDDVVIIGDSVTLKLYYYVLDRWNYEEDYLGGVQFLTAGSLGSGNALWTVSDESVHPMYKGQKMLLEDSIPLTHAKKAYIMLGTNDMGIFGIDGSIANYEELLDRILATSPDLEVFVQSVLPMYRYAQLETLNNEIISGYNKALFKMAQRLGHHYVDVASIMQTADGSLPYQYCSDPAGMGIHLTDIACEKWISFLRHHTP